MNSADILRMMSTSHYVKGNGLTCSEAAGAMAAILARLHLQLNENDFDFLVGIGGVLFREGLREFECSKNAGEIIHRAKSL